MRLLVVTPFYAPAAIYGGVARATQDLAGAVADLGFSVKVITTTGNDLAHRSDAEGRNHKVNVDYCRRIALSGSAFLSIPLLRKCRLECWRHDVVLSIGMWNFPSFIASCLARQFRLPNFVALHGMLMPAALGHHGLRKKAMLKTFESRRLSRANRVVCSSEMEETEYRRLKISDNSCLVPNIVDLRGVVANREAFRERHGVSSNLVLLFAGRLVPIKALDLTIQAFGRIARKHKDARLIMVGPSEAGYGDALRRLVTNLKLDEQVKFTGTLAGTAYWDAIRGADLVVLNSHSENFGLTAAEALGLGVPVLVSDRVGISDAILQRGAGVVTKPDIESISQAMDCLASNRDRLREMGRRGINLIHELYAPEAVGAQFARLVQDVVQSSKSCQN